MKLCFDTMWAKETCALVLSPEWCTSTSNAPILFLLVWQNFLTWNPVHGFQISSTALIGHCIEFAGALASTLDCDEVLCVDTYLRSELPLLNRDLGAHAIGKREAVRTACLYLTESIRNILRDPDRYGTEIRLFDDCLVELPGFARRGPNRDLEDVVFHSNPDTTAYLMLPHMAAFFFRCHDIFVGSHSGMVWTLRVGIDSSIVHALSIRILQTAMFINGQSISVLSNRVDPWCVEPVETRTHFGAKAMIADSDPFFEVCANSYDKVQCATEAWNRLELTQRGGVYLMHENWFDHRLSSVLARVCVKSLTLFVVPVASVLFWCYSLKKAGASVLLLHRKLTLGTTAMLADNLTASKAELMRYDIVLIDDEYFANLSKNEAPLVSMVFTRIVLCSDERELFETSLVSEFRWTIQWGRRFETKEASLALMFMKRRHVPTDPEGLVRSLSQVVLNENHVSRTTRKVAPTPVVRGATNPLLGLLSEAARLAKVDESPAWHRLRDMCSVSPFVLWFLPRSIVIDAVREHALAKARGLAVLIEPVGKELAEFPTDLVCDDFCLGATGLGDAIDAIKSWLIPPVVSAKTSRLTASVIEHGFAQTVRNMATTEFKADELKPLLSVRHVQLGEDVFFEWALRCQNPPKAIAATVFFVLNACLKSPPWKEGSLADLSNWFFYCSINQETIYKDPQAYLVHLGIRKGKGGVSKRAVEETGKYDLAWDWVVAVTRACPVRWELTGVWLDNYHLTHGVGHCVKNSKLIVLVECPQLMFFIEALLDGSFVSERKGYVHRDDSSSFAWMCKESYHNVMDASGTAGAETTENETKKTEPEWDDDNWARVESDESTFAERVFLDDPLCRVLFTCDTGMLSQEVIQKSCGILPIASAVAREDIANRLGICLLTVDKLVR